jgi:hypothetical protein
MRQQWNRVFFRRVLVSRGQVARYELQEPYDTLFSWPSSNKEMWIFE